MLVKTFENGSSIKARLLWSVTNLPPFMRVWAMVALSKGPHSQWPKSFSMNDTQNSMATHSGGAGTRIFGYPNPTFFGLPESNFSMSGMYPTRTRLYEKTHKIWSKKCIIPDKILNFLGTQTRLFGIPTLPDPTRIRLFTIRSIRYPTFCYPLHH